MSTQIVQADARSLPLPARSADLIVTSPPYYGMRNYHDSGQPCDGQIGREDSPREYVDALLECTAEWMRVLKPGGSMWVNLGDTYAGYNYNRGVGGKIASRADPERGVVTRRGLPPGTRTKSLMGLPWRYANRCTDDLGLTLREELIWDKQGLPERVKDRARHTHESWFHFTLRPQYYADPAGIRAWSAGKLPGSVWAVRNERPVTAPELGVRHFATFPLVWPYRLILGWSPPRGLILDPFGGTGTTALAAAALGRDAISADLSHDYCRLAQHRLSDWGGEPVIAGGRHIDLRRFPRT